MHMDLSCFTGPSQKFANWQTRSKLRGTPLRDLAFFFSDW